MAHLLADGRTLEPASQQACAPMPKNDRRRPNRNASAPSSIRQDMGQGKTTVYFDGACHLCSREIEHYRRKDKEGRLAFVDIADPHFDARREGLDPQEVHREMHVKLASGEVKKAVLAFTSIWRELPGYGWLSPLVEAFPVYPLAYAGYQVFARIRPYLPKRQRDACENGACYRS